MSDEEREARRRFVEGWRKKRAKALDEEIAENLKEIKRLNRQLRIMEIMRRFH